jgi:hypothetical protein
MKLLGAAGGENEVVIDREDAGEFDADPGAGAGHERDRPRGR